MADPSSVELCPKGRGSIFISAVVADERGDLLLVQTRDGHVQIRNALRDRQRRYLKVTPSPALEVAGRTVM